MTAAITLKSIAQDNYDKLLKILTTNNSANAVKFRCALSFLNGLYNFNDPNWLSVRNNLRIGLLGENYGAEDSALASYIANELYREGKAIYDLTLLVCVDNRIKYLHYRNISGRVTLIGEYLPFYSASPDHLGFPRFESDYTKSFEKNVEELQSDLTQYLVQEILTPDTLIYSIIIDRLRDYWEKLDGEEKKLVSDKISRYFKSVKNIFGGNIIINPVMVNNKDHIEDNTNNKTNTNTLNLETKENKDIIASDSKEIILNKSDISSIAAEGKDNYFLTLQEECEANHFGSILMYDTFKIKGDITGTLSLNSCDCILTIGDKTTFQHCSAPIRQIMIGSMSYQFLNSLQGWVNKNQNPILALVGDSLKIVESEPVIMDILLGLNLNNSVTPRFLNVGQISNVNRPKRFNFSSSSGSSGNGNSFGRNSSRSPSLGSRFSSTSCSGASTPISESNLNSATNANLNTHMSNKDEEETEDADAENISIEELEYKATILQADLRRVFKQYDVLLTNIIKHCKRNKTM